MRWREHRVLVAVAVLLLVAATTARMHIQARSPEDDTSGVAPAPVVATSPTFVDESSCANCHSQQVQAWRGSHHDLAMQEPTTTTVLGDFDNASFSGNGVNARFFQREGKFWINTEGADGQPADFEVKYTFGAEPLQQYLLALDRGRLQAFTIAWDVRRQRWFDLYPDERIDYRDPLHWTQPSQNWNFMCAECHSTDVKKNFDLESGSYRTSWKQIDVGCQACHGPASTHLSAAWPGKKDFPVAFAAPDATEQIETCARCHSRRSVISSDYRHGERFMQSHLPALLTDDLYFADGQIKDEVYEYGSFLQSRMHAQGVRCSDCHEPHSLKLRREGNELCVGCHNAAAPAARPGIDVSALKKKDYDSPAHHFHETGKPGAQCVDCHAPERVYMQVDARRDHSFRIPRPDISVRLGTPNACNSCHEKRSAKWTAEQVAKWYGPNRSQEPTFADAFAIDAADRAAPAAFVEGELLRISRDGSSPAIVRASALERLRAYPSQAALDALQVATLDADPLLRMAAANAFDVYPPSQRAAALPLLSDPVRAVRLAATTSAPPERLNATAVSEYERAQLANADQPGAHINIGNLRASLHMIAEAKAAYHTAIRLDRTFAPAYVNLADLQSRSGDNGLAMAVLQAGLDAVPVEGAQSAALHHSLGLALIRERRYDEALAELSKASKQWPGDSRYAYVLGVALYDTGKTNEGLATLKRALHRHPADRDLLQALAAYAHKAGDLALAAEYQKRLSGGPN